MVLEAGLSKQSGQSAAAQKSPEELEADFVRHTAAILMDAPATTLKVPARVRACLCVSARAWLVVNFLPTLRRLLFPCVLLKSRYTPARHCVAGGGARERSPCSHGHRCAGDGP